MSYDPAALSLGFMLLGGKYKVWVYQSTDQFSDVDATGYFSNAASPAANPAGMAEGDIVFVVETDQDPPTTTMATVSAINGTTGVGTLTAFATAGSPTFTTSSMATLFVTTEANLGSAAGSLIAFHGVPVVDQAALITLETTVSGSVIASRVKSILALLTEKGLMASA